MSFFPDDYSSVSCPFFQKCRRFAGQAFPVRDPDLIKAQIMAGRQGGTFFLQDIGHFQEAPALIRDKERKRNLSHRMGRDRGQRQGSSRDLCSIQCQRPGRADLIRRVQEIQMVLHHKDLLFHIIDSSERSVDILVFQQACMGFPVRIDQSVQTEVGIMLDFSVVAAVPVHVFSVLRFSLIHGMVAPFPDKAAAEGRIFFRQIQIFPEVSGTVAHGMAVFHQKEGLVRIMLQILCYLGKSRIHTPEQINVRNIKFPVPAQVERAFVMGQPCRIRFFGPAEGLLKSDPIAALIPHGPDQDTGTVAVPYDHGPDPVKGGFCEIRIVGDPDMGQTHPFRVIILPEVKRGSSMAFIVGFINDIEPHTVTELIEPGHIRIMAGPDRVEIVALDHAQIQERLVHTADRSGDRVRLVAVHAPECNGGPVQGQYTVFHFYLPEAHLLGNDFLSGVHDQCVKQGFLRVPEYGLLHGNPQDCLLIFPEGKFPPGNNVFSAGICQGQADRDRLSGEVEPYLQIRGLKIFGQICFDNIIPDPFHGPLQDIDIPEDAGKTELVLIFQIGSVAPFEDQDRQKVISFPQKTGHVKFRRMMGNLAVSHVSTVQPYIEAGIHPLKVQEGAGRIRVLMPCKVMQVGAAGILLGDVGRIKGKRITDVGILRSVISPQLPAERHLLLFPPLAGLIVRQIK